MSEKIFPLEKLVGMFIKLILNTSKQMKDTTNLLNKASILNFGETTREKWFYLTVCFDSQLKNKVNALFHAED
jgi:hypothetical protein